MKLYRDVRLKKLPKQKREQILNVNNLEKDCKFYPIESERGSRFLAAIMLEVFWFFLFVCGWILIYSAFQTNYKYNANDVIFSYSLGGAFVLLFGYLSIRQLLYALELRKRFNTNQNPYGIQLCPDGLLFFSSNDYASFFPKKDILSFEISSLVLDESSSNRGLPQILLGYYDDKSSDDLGFFLSKIEFESDNQLRKLRKEFMQWLSGTNGVSCNLEAALEDPESIKILDLSESNLEFLPDTIAKLTELKSLYLGGNNLKTLPATIGDLPYLRELRLYGNSIENLPEEILRCKVLEKIYLASTQINSLPKFFTKLKSLKVVHIDSFNIREQIKKELGRDVDTGNNESQPIEGMY